MSELIFRQRKYRNIGDLDVPITIEMHNSMWVDEMMEYETRDLLFGGRLWENPDLLKTADEKLKDKIRMGYYNTYPCTPTDYRGRLKPLSGYIYVGDLNGHMYVYHHEEDRENVVTKTDYTGNRWLD